MYTVQKEARHRWNVLRRDGIKVAGPFQLKREAAVQARKWDKFDGDVLKNQLNQKTAAVSASALLASAPPALLFQCRCGWIVVPAEAYRHFQDCLALTSQQ